MSPKAISVVKIEMIPVLGVEKELQGFCCFGYRIFESNERELGFILSGVQVLTFNSDENRKIKQRVRLRWLGDYNGFEVREDNMFKLRLDKCMNAKNLAIEMVVEED